MKNYFKIFRVRKFATGDEKQMPDERFVFFDDASPDEVQKAANYAKSHRINLEKKYPLAKISLWAPAVGVKCHMIGEGDMSS